eukprot:5703885-Amphidinium_carterae.1
MMFADLAEHQAFMQQSRKRGTIPGTTDIVELCGGSAMTTTLAVKAGFKARIKGGRNFDLLVGVNLNDPQQQKDMWTYLAKERPL